jgi:transposase, IS5 family
LRIEDVFAAQKSRLGLVIRTVGMMRARAKIGLAHLAYNPSTSPSGLLNGRTAPA